MARNYFYNLLLLMGLLVYIAAKPLSASELFAREKSTTSILRSRPHRDAFLLYGSGLIVCYLVYLLYQENETSSKNSKALPKGLNNNIRGKRKTKSCSDVKYEQVVKVNTSKNYFDEGEAEYYHANHKRNVANIDELLQRFLSSNTNKNSQQVYVSESDGSDTGKGLNEKKEETDTLPIVPIVIKKPRAIPIAKSKSSGIDETVMGYSHSDIKNKQQVYASESDGSDEDRGLDEEKRAEQCPNCKSSLHTRCNKMPIDAEC